MASRSVLIGLLAGLPFGLVAACSTFDSAEVDAADSSVEGGAVPVDGATEANGGDAATDDAAGPDGAANLLVNGDFELTPCGSWENNNASLATGTVASSGASACSVCRTGVGSVTLFQSTTVKTKVGEQYRATVWTRTLPDASVPGTQRLLIHFGPSDDADTTVGPPTGVFQKIEAAGQVKTGGDTLRFELRLGGSGAECVLVDDAQLVRVP